MIDNNLNDKLFDVIIKEAFSSYSIADDNTGENLSGEEKELIFANKENICKNIEKTVNKPKQKKVVKRTILIAAAMTLCMMVVVNASFIQKFFNRAKIQPQGDSLKITIDNTKTSPYAGITEFQNRKDVIVPDWLPDNMNLSRIDDDESYLSISYRWQDYYLHLNQDYADKTTMTKAAGKNEIDITYQDVLGMEAMIIYSKSEIGLESYTALWQSNECQYYIHTNLPKEEFEKILKNLKFLE